MPVFSLNHRCLALIATTGADTDDRDSLQGSGKKLHLGTWHCGGRDLVHLQQARPRTNFGAPVVLRSSRLPHTTSLLQPKSLLGPESSLALYPSSLPACRYRTRSSRLTEKRDLCTYACLTCLQLDHTALHRLTIQQSDEVRVRGRPDLSTRTVGNSAECGGCSVNCPHAVIEDGS